MRSRVAWCQIRIPVLNPPFSTQGCVVSRKGYGCRKVPTGGGFCVPATSKNASLPMAIFRIENSTILKSVREKQIDLERDLQRLTEQNLEQVFGLKFIATEFSLHNFRIDTLAFDAENKSFVIIEYKRDRSFSVIDQGYSYLSLMLNNKAEFILAYNERMDVPLERDAIDWSQSRVLFLANSFTAYQQNAINFRDLPIELWEVRVYEGDLIAYNQRIADDAKESIQTITDNKTIQTVAREIKSYTITDHVSHGSDDVQSVYSQIREMLIGLGSDVKEVPKKYYIAYKTGSNFADVEIRTKDLKIFLNVRSGELNDPSGRARDLTKPKPVGHWGNGDYEIVIKPNDDLMYVFELIRQAYSKSH